MAIIVHKYGGTSMGSPERIKNVARRVAKWHRAGHQMVVVVSAMSGETNRLIALAKEIQPNPDPRELDVVASTGEQVSIGLLAMALKAIGVEAVSFNGSQVAVHTDSAFGKARIESIDSDAVKKELDAGKVVIVAGFQGRDAAGNVTTLGRGGSDTSGVARAISELRPSASSSRMSTACTRPIRASSPRPGVLTPSALRKCSSSRASAPRCCRSAAWSLPASTTCPCACSRASPTPTFPLTSKQSAAP